MILTGKLSLSLNLPILMRKCRSMADQDTDRWVFEVLAPDIRRKLKDIEYDFNWVDLVLARSHIHARCLFSSLSL